jgi:hypothetical protein
MALIQGRYAPGQLLPDDRDGPLVDRVALGLLPEMIAEGRFEPKPAMPTKLAS